MAVVVVVVGAKAGMAFCVRPRTCCRKAVVKVFWSLNTTNAVCKRCRIAHGVRLALAPADDASMDSHCQRATQSGSGLVAHVPLPIVSLFHGMVARLGRARCRTHVAMGQDARKVHRAIDVLHVGRVETVVTVAELHHQARRVPHREVVLRRQVLEGLSVAIATLTHMGPMSISRRFLALAQTSCGPKVGPPPPRPPRVPS